MPNVRHNRDDPHQRTSAAERRFQWKVAIVMLIAGIPLAILTGLVSQWLWVHLTG